MLGVRIGQMRRFLFQIGSIRSLIASEVIDNCAPSFYSRLVRLEDEVRWELDVSLTCFYSRLVRLEVQNCLNS